MNQRIATIHKRRLTLVNALWLVCLLSGFSTSVRAYTCYDSTGTILNSDTGGKVSSVYVNLQPNLGAGQNLVVDLSSSIFCKNDAPTIRNDRVSMLQGSAYSGLLTNFTGSLKYYGISYKFPLNSQTGNHNFTSGNYAGWNTQLYLTPVSTASGLAISAGSHIATLVMYQEGSDINGGGNIRTSKFTWNIYSNNSVIIPTGGCDVSSRNVTVTLPEYPGSTAIPLTVRCGQNQKIGFYLSGTTADAASSIFTNTSSASPAQGIGVQLLRNGSIMRANTTVSMGTVGTSAVNLGLTATYARTSGQVTAGNVQSIIGVTFVYQ
ncbi:fimbrial protein [Klebsiella oxytoca]|uniref:Fimbrial protein n=1 Tax=Klebsiella oxytoca TaxID=571 RepID=A0A6B8N163_KLEOX|nr:fimbrial protein [Klebsiella oxytoca]QGN39587.1 fimbrial protein [Klebsiella oxytoca]